MDKAPDAFRTISEVADDLDIPQHVLRFWESRFTQIRPMKRGGGRRYYRPDDVALLRGIRHLLYGQGYTIRGVQRILREQGIGFVQTVWEAGAAQPEGVDERDIKADAEDIAEVQAPPAAAAPSERREPAHERREPTLDGPATRPPRADTEGVPHSDAIVPSTTQFAASDRQAVRAALEELAECRRLLDAAFVDPV